MKEKILIVDDEQDILNFLNSVLKSEGYDVLTAEDGVVGLERFQKEKPDLVITDMKMPRKKGLELLREIKESGSDVDVIILTGHSDEVTTIDCFHNGAYDYLVKPLEDIDVLLAAVSRALDKRNLEIKNRLLITELKEMAVKDPLTGLNNFRSLHTYLDEELIRSERYGHSFCSLMLDIDHFKAVNDTYGHLFGDYVLKKLGEIILKSLRSADSLYRYGGEEFFIVMPETDKNGALIGANRLMEAIREHTFVFDGHQIKITVSMGGCLFPDQANDKKELIKVADQALYQAKEAGRDRVVFEGAPVNFPIRLMERITDNKMAAACN